MSISAGSSSRASLRYRILSPALSTSARPIEYLRGLPRLGRRGNVDGMHTAVSSPRPLDAHCPGCCSPAGPAEPYCRHCGIWLAGPHVAELRWIDCELRRVDAARTWLISRRAVLLDELIRLASQAPASTSAGSTGPVPSAGRPGAVPRPGARAARPEMSGRTTARLLLAAGASLVVIAVVIFTIAGWSRIGPLDRCAILLGATALVLAAPGPLIRRRLTATAESVAAVGLVLTVGDAYLLQRVIPIPAAAGSLLAAAAGCAALAAAWAGYGAQVRLNGPRLAAIGLARFPGPLAMAGFVRLLGGPSAPLAGPVALGLVLTSGADVLLAGRARGRDAVSTAASVAAVTTWTCGILVAAAGLAVSARWPAAAWQAAALGAAALAGLAGPRRNPALASRARPAAAISGALAVISLAIPVSAVLPAGWGLAAVAASGAAVTAIALRQRAPQFESAAAGAAAILASSAVLAAPVAVRALFRPAWPVWPGSSTGGALTPWLPAWPTGPGAPTTLAVAGLAALLAPGKLRRPAWPAGLVAVAAAAGSVAADLTGWAALATLTAAAAILLGVSVVLRDRMLAAVAAGSGGALAAAAALWSLAAPAATIGELATLAVIFHLTALRARHAFTAVLATAGALGAATGLAWAVPLASGWPARYAAFAAVAVAVTAVAAATALRRIRPVLSVVLDLGAGPVALLSAAVTAGQRDAFAVIAVTAAMIASGTAWLRTGQRRLVAVAAAGCAAVAALAVQWRPLARALLAPGPVIAHPWRQFHLAGGPPVLPVAVIVLAACLAALVTAVGAWRGRGRASLDAVAVALPLVAAPAGLAAGIGYWLVVTALLALTLALTAWAAFGRSLAPAAAALISAALTIAWALATPVPTLAVLGSLTAAYALCACRSRLASVRVAAGSLSVAAAAALAECLVAAAHRPGWQSGLAALGVAAGAQLAVALMAGRVTGPGAPRATVARQGAPGATIAGHAASAGAGAAIKVGAGIEATAWLVTAAGVAQCLGRPWPASLALAIAGISCLGAAARAGRRPAIWPGLTLCFAAWCAALAAAGVGVAEAYTGPAAVIAIGAGWRTSRREPQPHSWLGYGPGLVLLLLPSLILAWQDPGWIRPVLVAFAAAGIALAGARLSKQAPLVTGAVAAVLDTGRQLGPPAVRLVQALPGWIPAAAGGAALLWAGATYEARLRDLTRIRRTLAAMS
jgi:hypothetical protein